MNLTNRTWLRSQKLALVTLIALLPTWAGAAAPGDALYIHCQNGGADFRVSELNHSVSQFSDRYQEYRAICADCDIIEWGNRIVMKNGRKTLVLIDRLTGDISIQRNDAGADAGPFDVHSYHGTCLPGTPRVANAGTSVGARVF